MQLSASWLLVSVTCLRGVAAGSSSATRQRCRPYAIAMSGCRGNTVNRHRVFTSRAVARMSGRHEQHVWQSVAAVESGVRYMFVCFDATISVTPQGTYLSDTESFVS
jgi:hypothetical protein